MGELMSTSRAPRDKRPEDTLTSSESLKRSFILCNSTPIKTSAAVSNRRRRFGRISFMAAHGIAGFD
jgi:hypothetical protein